MKEDLDIAVMIDEYLAETMSESERAAFESRMRLDPSLKSEVEEMRIANEALHLTNLAAIRLVVGQDVAKLPFESNGAQRGSKKWWVVLAGVLGVSIGWLLFQPKEGVQKALTPIDLNQTKDSKPEAVKTPEPPHANAPSDQGSRRSNTAGLNESASQETIMRDLTIMDSIELPQERKNARAETHVSSDIQEPIETQTSIRKEDLPVKVSCNDEIKVEVSQTCIGEKTGQILVSSSNEAEYLYELTGTGVDNSVGLFDELEAGQYHVLMHDEFCRYQKEVTIIEKWCPLNQSFSFNPEYGEKWEPRYSEGMMGEVVVYNRVGREMVRFSFGDENESWDGQGKDGELVPVGPYIGMIIYDNGNKEKVELTVVK